MLQRCYSDSDKCFHLYGGRGITVCERWRNSFQNFLEDMGERTEKSLTLDRYPDKNGNYEPENCRWATKKQQLRNTRSNRILEFNGKRQSVVEWSEELGIDQHLIWMRLHNGMSVERVLFVGKYPRGGYTHGIHRTIKQTG